MTRVGDDAVRAVVSEHVEAFNAHDRARLLAGLSDDVVWATGTDTFRGARSLTDVFDDGLWAMQPSLTIVELLVDGHRAAARMQEALTVDGNRQRFEIACFFDIDGDLIRDVKVFREGSADIA